MTGDFRRIVWTIAHLPASACTTSAPGSKSPLGRGGGGGAAPLGVLPGFPVVGVRLCGGARERHQTTSARARTARASGQAGCGRWRGRVHVRGGGRCSEQFKTLLNRKKTHSFLNKSCVTNDSESIEHPSENHEKFGRYGTSGTCRGGGISSVKVRRAEIVPRSASEAACHPENTWGPSTDRSRATCAPKSP